MFFFLSIKKVDQKQFSPKKICWLKKCWLKTLLVQKIILNQSVFSPKKIYDPESFWSKQFLGQIYWHGQMSSGQMLPRQMSPWQLASVKEGLRNLLLLKFGQNRVSNSWDIADVKFRVGGGGGGGGWWSAQSFSCQTQLKVMLVWVEVELGFWQYVSFSRANR